MQLLAAAARCAPRKQLATLVTPSDTTFSLSEATRVHRGELIRSVPTSRFLRGRVLESSDGTAEDYARSEEVETIGTFVSHSWNCDASLKYNALLYHFYSTPWLCGCMLLLLVSEVVAVHFDWTLWTWYQINGSNEVVHVGTFGTSWCALLLLPGATFYLMPYLVPSWVVRRWPHMNCFLDKCSIAQADSPLKKASIAQLGAYIKRSERFLLVLDHGYMQRLWCVYELAVFSKINPPLDKLQIVSVNSVRHALVLLWWQILSNALCVPGMCTVFGTPAVNAWLAANVPDALVRSALLLLLYTTFMVPCFMVPCYFFLYPDAERLEKERRALEEQLKTFRVETLHCSVEEDRVFVEGRIRSFFGSFEAFEGLVKNVLKERLMPHFVPNVLPRGLLNVGIVLPQFLFWSDFYIMSTFSPSGATAYSANTLTMAIGFTFLYLELGMRFSSLIFKRMRASTAIADAWKRIFSVLLCSVVFAFLCGLGCVLSSPIVPQEIYGVALGVAVALLLWTWP